jgi:hydrogenase nickel incorporation protein HypA/HybF
VPVHELSIAMEIIRQVSEIARQHNAERVDEVEVQVGVMRQVQEDALRMSFEAARDGTIAQNARLIVIEEPMAAECNACGNRFAPELDNFVCPGCGQANARIVAGNDIILKSLVCQTSDEAAVS